MSSPGSVDPKPSTLRRLAISGAGWTLLRFGGQNLLRLGGNLVLTRLLFPEAFGLMALVTVTLEALELFSDVGLQQSIVTNPRGAELRFLRTLWTVQIVRGCAIFVILLAISSPVAQIYGEPTLAGMLALSSVTALLRGFTSMRVALLRRQLAIGRMAILDLSVQAVGLAITLIYGWIHPTVWVLPAGAVAGRALFCVASHLWIPGPTMGFAWDAQVRLEVIRFGRWIFISSILGYLVNSLDRILLGYTVSMAELGTYTIALMLVRVVLQVERRLRDEVMYPVIARMAEVPEAQWRRALTQARLGILCVTHPTLVGLAVFGPELIDLLYDDRYAGAGWMLQVLAAGFLVKTTMEPADSVLLARSDSFGFMQVLAVRSSVLTVAMGLAAWAFGVAGLVATVAFAETLAYPAVIRAVRPHKAWLPALDAAALAVAFACLGLGLFLKARWL